jgi:hypothetical protein
MSDNSKKRDAGRRHARLTILAAASAAAVTAVLSGCATSPTDTTPPPTSKLVTVPGNSQPEIVLTQLGAQRIGLETAAVAVSGSGRSTFPYTALLYEPNGQAAVYVQVSQFTFTRHFVTVASITGSTVTVTTGVTPGDRVATSGSEELLGVQNGVGEET